MLYVVANQLLLVYSSISEPTLALATRQEFIAITKDPTKLRVLWARMDGNGNGNISLAEIDKLMVARYPLLNNKPALMRAYKQACLMEGGDGDAVIEPPEFPQLLVRLTALTQPHSNGRP